jgi:hypothetical protein
MVGAGGVVTNLDVASIRNSVDCVRVMVQDFDRRWMLSIEFDIVKSKARTSVLRVQGIALAIQLRSVWRGVFAGALGAMMWEIDNANSPSVMFDNRELLT